jgi:hypothetical protein
MAPVVGSPGDNGVLERPRAHRQQEEPKERVRLVRAMREQAVIAGGDAEDRDRRQHDADDHRWQAWPV